MLDCVHFDYFITQSTSSIFLTVNDDPYEASVAWIPIDKSAYLRANKSLAPSPHIPIFHVFVFSHLVNLE